jgi:HSP20 family molecular chaperone IbpA
MHTIIPSLSSSSPLAPAESINGFRQPCFECADLAQALKLVVLVPGVEAAGVEIVSRGPDLVVTARKPHVVRVNWQALHLESVQHDYQLALRLGHALDFEELRADLRDGVLTIVVPKREAATGRLAAKHRRVA